MAEAEDPDDLSNEPRFMMLAEYLKGEVNDNSNAYTSDLDRDGSARYSCLTPPPDRPPMPSLAESWRARGVTRGPAGLQLMFYFIKHQCTQYTACVIRTSETDVLLPNRTESLGEED